MRGRRVVWIVVAAAIAVGSLVEWLAYDAGLGIGLALADLAAGCILIVCGAIAWDRRPDSRVGALMGLAGATWFLGTAFEPLVFLHRGPLVHLYLSFPSGRIRSRPVLLLVGAAYVDAAIEPLARNDVLTLVLAAAVAIAAVRLFAGTSSSALAAATTFAVVLALGAVERLAGGSTDRAVLWAYDSAIAATAVLLSVDLVRRRWQEAVVTGLVVDLGAGAEAATLRARLARALGDPSLVIGYRVAWADGFVDDAGRPVELPPQGSERTVTPLVDRGERVAVLIHDGALQTDRRLVESVAAAARIAVANATLQAEARAKEDELEASRRRIVEAGDIERRRIRRDLQHGAGESLERVASSLARARPGLDARDASVLAGLQRELVGARAELDEFARGVMPTALTDEGLGAALAQLAGRSSIPVALRGSVGRLATSVEAALFFVCSEALTNVARHAGASRATIELEAEPGRVSVTVADDGAGGADPSAGSGLRGLADRVEALGGRLTTSSPPGGGTRIVAEIPTS
jgi:signal transduction histidine kinase